MKLFTILANLNGVHEAIQNPEQAGKEYLLGVLQGYLLVWGIWILGISLLFGLLGFTSILGGPHVFFEVLFYIWLALVSISLIGVLFAWKLLKRKWLSIRDEWRKKNAKKVEVIKVKYIEK